MKLKKRHIIIGSIIGASLGIGAVLGHPSALHCHSSNGYPDPQCTPGVVVETQASVVCNRSTKTVRPPVSYTNQLKVKQLSLYDYVDKNPLNYEEDHLVPLELGGSPTDPKNLWPEPYVGTEGAKVKDQVENLLHSEVCSGKISLDKAQRCISTNWMKCNTLK